MKTLLLVLSIVSTVLTAPLEEMSVANGTRLRRAEWGEFTGTVTVKRSRLILTDNTGSIKLRFRRTPYYLKDELLQSVNTGDTLTIVGVKASNRKDKLHPLMIHSQGKQLFQQPFFRKEEALKDTNSITILNQLQQDYTNYYTRKSKSNFIIGGASCSLGLLALMNAFASDDLGVSLVSIITSWTFIPSTVANTTAGILYKRRCKRVPDYETPKVTFNLQFRSSKESRGLFLVGNF